MRYEIQHLADSLELLSALPLHVQRRIIQALRDVGNDGRPFAEAMADLKRNLRKEA
jgi:hypothetical protein